MTSRPRCRDWTALLTQQLRLRNLIQISGHNIRCPSQSCQSPAATTAAVYYTLHLTAMSAPIYTSPASCTPANAIWPEIQCPLFLTSPALSVCIRVWQSAANAPSDTQLFLWMVHFSGLVPISKRTDVGLRPNSLVFHLHGGFFTSAAQLHPASVLDQLAFVVGHKQRHQIRPGAVATEATADLGAAASNAVAASNGNASQTPHGDGTASATSATDGATLKLRYIERRFYEAEVRRSYSLEQLLQLQRTQRQLQRQTQLTQQIREQICARSAFCMAPPPLPPVASELGGAGRSSQGPTASTPLTLHRLLNANAAPPAPELLWRAQQVRRQLETARFRTELLRRERAEAAARSRQLERELQALGDAAVERESWLLASYHELRRERERAEEMRAIVGTQVVRVRWLREAVRRRQLQLLMELGEVFAVAEVLRVGEKPVAGLEVAAAAGYTINGAMLPSSERFTEQTSASALSVALGWAAHLTVMAAVVLDQPLRNAVLLRGSATRIRDDVKVLPEADREFPLFCRSCPPPIATRYACFLLNQNISQLLVWLGHTTIDCRETLHNLLKLMNTQLILLQQQQRRPPSPLPQQEQQQQHQVSPDKRTAFAVADESCIAHLVAALDVCDGQSNGELVAAQSGT